MKDRKKNNFPPGFTLMEVSVVIAMLSVLLGLVWINVLGTKERSSQASTVDVLISDIRSQQLKAMLGDSEGRVTKDTYGIRLDGTSYTLFHGPNYSPADPTNATFPLGDNEVFQNVSFPNSIIRFASVSGEIVGFSEGANAFTLFNTSLQSQRIIELNQYGSVTTLE